MIENVYENVRHRDIGLMLAELTTFYASVSFEHVNIAASEGLRSVQRENVRFSGTKLTTPNGEPLPTQGAQARLTPC